MKKVVRCKWCGWTGEKTFKCAPECKDICVQERWSGHLHKTKRICDNRDTQCPECKSVGVIEWKPRNETHGEG